MSNAVASTQKVLNLVPDNAPFTEEQRGWLNGFFAGLLSGALAAQGGQPAAEAASPVKAQEVEEETPWHDPGIAMDERLKMAEGKRHPLKLMAAMAQLDCGSCGYLCKSYAEAIASGADKDLTKCTPGGRDTSKMLKALQQNAPASAPAAASTAKPSVAEAKSAGTFDRSNPFAARLLCSDPLNSAESSKDTRLVMIDLRSSGISYKPGDALGVYPENCPQHVEQILECLGATGAEDVMGWDDRTVSFRNALHRDFTITRPSPDLLDLLARSAADSTDAAELARLRDSDEGSGDLEILDLLVRFPSAKPAAGDFVATLSPMAPRLYSISSSLAAYPDQVHLTVGAVRYQNSVGRSCKGVASTFLAERIRPGQRLRVFVQPSHRFALPAGGKPIIMVGPGTGVAPFRAFLQDRRATKATGKAWLFFGDQKASSDFLFRDELTEYLADGVLTKLDTAFSRDQAEKVYVQTRMTENAAELWQWLQAGAHFYVCGDAKRMANDVDKALRQAIVIAGGLTTEAADQYVSDLSKTGRYQRDVY